jgi:hypothetical protein
MTAVGQTRSFGDIGSMSGLTESGHSWAIYEYKAPAVGGRAETACCHSSKTRTPPERCDGSTGGASGASRGPLDNVRTPLEKQTGAADIPHGTSGVRSELHRAQASAVLYHSRTVPQGHGRAGPAFTCRAIGGECNLIVLDTGDVLHDAFAVRGPRIDAEGSELCSVALADLGVISFSSISV